MNNQAQYGRGLAKAIAPLPVITGINVKYKNYITEKEYVVFGWKDSFKYPRPKIFIFASETVSNGFTGTNPSMYQLRTVGEAFSVLTIYSFRFYLSIPDIPILKVQNL